MRQPTICAHPYMCIYLYYRWADTSLMCFMPSLQIDLIAKLFTSRSTPIHKLANIHALIVASNDNIILARYHSITSLQSSASVQYAIHEGTFHCIFECSLNLFTLPDYSQVISITGEYNHSIHFLRALHEWNAIHAFKLTL